MNKLITGFNAALLLLLFMMTVEISNNSVIFGQSENMSEQMSSAEQMGGATGEKLISSISEWIGIFSIGIVTGLLAFQTNALSSNTIILERTKRVVISIAILSLSVGAIHLLLVQEHSKESIWWGIFFLIAG